MFRITATIRDCRGRLPSRLTCAWVFVGATVAVCPMYLRSAYFGIAQTDDYFPWDFTGFADMAHEERSPMHRPHGSSGFVQIFGVVVWEGNGPWGEAERIVDLWHAGIALAFGLIGAFVFGLIVHFRRHPPRAIATDLRLWLLIAALLFAGLVRVGLPGQRTNMYETVARQVEFFRDGHFDRSDVSPLLAWLVRNSMYLSVAATIVGWAMHVILVSWGVRFPRRRAPDQAGDYDDRSRTTAESPTSGTIPLSHPTSEVR